MTDETQPVRGTQAHMPDLSWSQVRETVLMLELAAGQIEAAMRDSNSSVEVLTDSFTSMAGYIKIIGDMLKSLPESSELGASKANLQGIAQQVAEMMQKAIVAFQFYDKLTQRLSHVCNSLGALGDLVGDQRRLFNPYEWVALQGKIRANYSTPEETRMFEAVMAGIPVQEALERFMSEIKDRGDDIELF